MAKVSPIAILAAAALALAVLLFGNSTAMTAELDVAALSVYPLEDIVIADARTYASRLGYSPERDAKTLALIDALPPERRTLFWLAWLRLGWGRDGLHTFFFLDGGNFAPQVSRALADAGLKERAAIFDQAMAAFVPPYPTDKKKRGAFFAWSLSSQAPLTGVDIRLMSLAAAFGERGSLTSDIEAYVRRTPALVEWTEGLRSKLTDADRLESLTRRLTVKSADLSEALHWPTPYRKLFFLDLFNLEMLNGGVPQFFDNSSGDWASQVASALREAGLPRHAAAVETGMAMFGDPYPTDGKVRGRSRYRNGEVGDFDRKLEALTAEVDDGAISDAMLEIARDAEILPR